MASISVPEESLINSIVGEGTHFRGNLELSGLLRIDGDYSGTIHTSGKVVIGKNGRVDCTINAGTVVVGGVLRGAVYATEKVIILSSALVIGIVHAPRLIAEEGVLIDGEFRIHGTAEVAVAAGDQAAEQTQRRGLFGLGRPRTLAAQTDPSGNSGTILRNPGFDKPSYTLPGRG